MKKITLIAEIGENHLGKIELAKKMIVEAKNSGADIVKFQSYNKQCLKKKDPEYSWFNKVSLSDADHHILNNFCKRKKIRFMSSPFSVERAKFLCEELKLREIKVASAKMTNSKLLKYLNKNCKVVYLSTGCSNLREIHSSLNLLKNVEVKLLHCVSEYPLNINNANLLAIRLMKEKFKKFEIGYSDHSIGNEAVIAAITLGATVIEKHFTLNKKFTGTDHILSATPKELTEIRKQSQKILKLLGKKKKLPSRKEKKIKRFIRNRFLD